MIAISWQSFDVAKARMRPKRISKVSKFSTSQLCFLKTKYVYAGEEGSIKISSLSDECRVIKTLQVLRHDGEFHGSKIGERFTPLRGASIEEDLL